MIRIYVKINKNDKYLEMKRVASYMGLGWSKRGTQFGNRCVDPGIDLCEPV
jgi:hypothetical protein